MAGLPVRCNADPRYAPTVDYVADFEITRASDYSINLPARYVYSDRRARIEMVGIVTLIDLDRKRATTMIPRVRTYWTPTPIANPPADLRRWIGVEAETAEVVDSETLLGQPVTKYWVRGTIFEDRIPFEGNVWTTTDNIVLKVDGTGKVDQIDTPVKVKPVQLSIGPVDQRLLEVPDKYGKARGHYQPEE